MQKIHLYSGVIVIVEHFRPFLAPLIWIFFFNLSYHLMCTPSLKYEIITLRLGIKIRIEPK